MTESLLMSPERFFMMLFDAQLFKNVEVDKNMRTDNNRRTRDTSPTEDFEREIIGLK